MRDSPVYALNRAIALAQTGETTEALAELEALVSRKDMQEYLLLDCAQARIHELDGRPDAAIDCYLRALSKATAPHEKTLLERKLRGLTDG